MAILSNNLQNFILISL